MTELLPIDGESKSRIPRAPAGLRAAGKRYWREMNELYEFDVEKLELLKQAARTIDLLERLQQAVDEAETLRTLGSQKQLVSIPEVGALKEHRALLVTITKALELPSEEGNDGRMTRSESARYAANVRWGGRTRRHG
jgi:hypothetical protein